MILGFRPTFWQAIHMRSWAFTCFPFPLRKPTRPFKIKYLVADSSRPDPVATGTPARTVRSTTEYWSSPDTLGHLDNLWPLWTLNYLTAAYPSLPCSVRSTRRRRTTIGTAMCSSSPARSC